MQYAPVPIEQQEDIRQPRRAEWFKALLDHGMLKIDGTTRPTISKAQQAVLDAQGQRIRSRAADGGVYIWVEDVPAEDLNEAADLESHDASQAPMSDERPVPDDELPL